MRLPAFQCSYYQEALTLAIGLTCHRMRFKRRVPAIQTRCILMFNRAVLILVLLGFAGYALADGINNPAVNGNGVGFGEGINNLGAGGLPPPSGSCSGTIDLSTGCVAPMLGAL